MKRVCGTANEAQPRAPGGPPGARHGTRTEPPTAGPVDTTAAVLQALADGRGLPEVLRSLARLVEARAPREWAQELAERVESVARDLES